MAGVAGQAEAGSEDTRPSGNSASCHCLGKPVPNRDFASGLMKGCAMIIYVGNLSLETTEDELRKEFTEFGEVISVTIMNDKHIGSGQPRGYGYVEMASKSAGATAITRLEGKTLRDRVVTVVQALPLSDKSGMSLSIKSNNRFNRKRERYTQ